MKKLLSLKTATAFIVSSIVTLSGVAQPRNPRHFDTKEMTNIKTKVDASLLSADDKACDISYEYENSSGWNSDRRLFTTTGCSGLSFLTGTQGNHNFISGRLRLDNVQDASMNRVYRSFTSILSNSFTADFEANINDGLVGYALLALTQNDSPPLHDFGTSCSTTPTNNSAIIVNIVKPISPANSPMDITIISKYGTSLITSPTGFHPQGGISYFYRLIRDNASTVRLQIYSDANRLNLIHSTSCISINPNIAGLKTIQHANNPLGGYARSTNGYIDNVCIKANADNICCTPKITGNNTICEAATPTTFQVNAVAGNSYIWTVPSDVAYTTNASNSQITITNWGPISQIPKQVDVKVKMYCHCDSFVASYPVFVYPARNTSFNIQNLGNNGTSLTTFEALAPMGVAGTIHQWEIFLSDASGATPNHPVGLRNIGWQTSTGSGNSVYTLNPIGSSMNYPPFPTNSVQYPYVDLTVGKFYLIRHGMYYEGNTCEWKASDRVIYINQSFMVKNLGDPKTTEFKRNVEELQKSEQSKNITPTSATDEPKNVDSPKAINKRLQKRILH